MMNRSGWLTIGQPVWNDKGYLPTHEPSIYNIPATGDVSEHVKTSSLSLMRLPVVTRTLFAPRHLQPHQGAPDQTHLAAARHAAGLSHPRGVWLELPAAPGGRRARLFEYTIDYWPPKALT